MWRRLAPTMEAFFRLDSDTACDEPNAQQSKAQGVFKDAKKKKEEAKDRKAANDKIGAFGNALDKMKANMAENQQPMREALEIAKRDEARKDAREKRAIEDGKKMEQERQAAEKERREFRKSGDEFRRKSLENHKKLVQSMNPDYDRIPAGESVIWEDYSSFWRDVVPPVPEDQRAEVEQQFPSLRRMISMASSKKFESKLFRYGEGKITQRTASLVVDTIHEMLYVPRMK